MANDIDLSSTADINVEKLSSNHHQSSIYAIDSVRSLKENQEEKSYSSYFKIPQDDNRNVNSTQFQDPFFYEQPLDFHYNRPMSTVIRSDYETGDRIPSAHEIIFNKYQKDDCLPPNRKQIEKCRIAQQNHIGSKRNKNKVIKMKKNRSVKNLNGRKNKNKKVNQNRFKRLQSKSKNHETSIVKRYNKQQRLTIGKNKILLKKALSANKSILKTQKKQRFNITNNRITSKIPSLQPMNSRIKRVRSLSQCKNRIVGNKKISRSNTNRTSSTSRRNNHMKTKSISNKINYEMNRLILNPILQLNNQRTMKMKLAIKQSDQNMIKSITTNKETNQTQMPLTLSTGKKVSNDKVSSTSALLPLSMDNAQLRNKNNNKRVLKKQLRGNNSQSTDFEKKPLRSTNTGMILRSRTILIGDIDSTKRKKS